jgi:hypothetical protein
MDSMKLHQRELYHVLFLSIFIIYVIMKWSDICLFDAFGVKYISQILSNIVFWSWYKALFIIYTVHTHHDPLR